MLELFLNNSFIKKNFDFMMRATLQTLRQLNFWFTRLFVFFWREMSATAKSSPAAVNETDSIHLDKLCQLLNRRVMCKSSELIHLHLLKRVDLFVDVLLWLIWRSCVCPSRLRFPLGLSWKYLVRSCGSHYGDWPDQFPCQSLIGFVLLSFLIGLDLFQRLLIVDWLNTQHKWR